MLQGIKIENFKKFQKVELNPSNFTVLMGENGSGKTSILQAIALGLRIFSTTDLIRYDVRSRKLRFRDKGVPYTQLPGLAVEDQTDVFYAKTPRGGTGGGVTPIKIELIDLYRNRYKLEITNLFGAYTAKCTSGPSDFVAVPELLFHRPLFISGFVGIPTSEERFFPVAMEDRLLRGRASDILRNLLLDTYEVDSERFERLKVKIKENFNFEIGDVSFEKEKDLNVHASYREQVAKRVLRLDLSTAGSGFLQVLQILTPIYRFAATSRVILLDEPDAHLHPNLQRTTARVLQEVAQEEGLQIIIATHSTAIIREVEPESVVPVTNQRPRLVALGSADQIESEISLRLDNFTAAKASIAGRVLFVEDKEVKLLERIDSLIGTGLFEGPSAVPVMSSQGKDDKVPFRIKGAIQEITGEPIDVFFIRDGDGMPDEWRRKLVSYAQEKGVNLVLLSRHEIESYLLNPVLISRVLGGHSVAVSPDQVQADLEVALRNVIGMSRFGFDKTLRDSLYKTGRLLNEEYGFGDAEKEAAKIRAQYEKLEDFESLVAIAPAKEALGEYLAGVRSRFKVQITDTQLIKALVAEDVDTSLVSQLRMVSRLSSR